MPKGCSSDNNPVACSATPKSAININTYSDYYINTVISM